MESPCGTNATEYNTLTQEMLFIALVTDYSQARMVCFSPPAWPIIPLLGNQIERVIVGYLSQKVWPWTPATILAWLYHTTVISFLQRIWNGRIVKRLLVGGVNSLILSLAFGHGIEKWLLVGEVNFTIKMLPSSSIFCWWCGNKTKHPPRTPSPNATLKDFFFFFIKQGQAIVVLQIQAALEWDA